jgi:hypothetical protein
MQRFLLHFKMFHSRQVVNVQVRVISIDTKSNKILIKLSRKMKVQNTILNVVPKLVGAPASNVVAIKTAVCISMHTVTVCIIISTIISTVTFLSLSTYQPSVVIAILHMYLCIHAFALI